MRTLRGVSQKHPGAPREVYLDTGARTPAEVEAQGISPGDPVAPVTDFELLANNRYVAKAWDDRVGCAVMLEVMRRLQHSYPSQSGFLRRHSLQKKATSRCAAQGLGENYQS